MSLWSVSLPGVVAELACGLFMGQLSFNRVPVWTGDNEMGLQGASVSLLPPAEGGSEDLGLLSGW